MFGKQECRGMYIYIEDFLVKVCMYLCICVFSIFFRNHRTNEAKLYVESQKDRQGKLIHLIQVICCSSLLSAPGRAGTFSRDLSTILAPESKAFSGALKI